MPARIVDNLLIWSAGTFYITNVSGNLKLTLRMTWEQLQGYLKGKIFLIGVTFIDQTGKFIEQYETHGTVLELTNDGLLKIKKRKVVFFECLMTKTQ